MTNIHGPFIAVLLKTMAVRLVRAISPRNSNSAGNVGPAQIRAAAQRN